MRIWMAGEKPAIHVHLLLLNANGTGTVLRGTMKIRRALLSTISGEGFKSNITSSDEDGV